MATADPARETAPRSSTRKTLQRALFWAAALGILAWIFSRVPPGQTLAAVRDFHLPWFIAALLVFSLLTLVLDSLTHYWLFNRFNPPVDFAATLLARGESYLLLSLGFLYGQGGMAYFMSRRAGKPLAEVTGSIFFLMFNNLLSLLAVAPLSLLAAAEFLPGFRGSREWNTITRFLVIAWPLALGQVLFFAREWRLRLRARMKGGLYSAFDRARAGDYLTASLLRTLQFGLWGGFTLAALAAAGIRIPGLELLTLGALIGLVSAIPTPARLGTSQGAWVLLFSHRADPAALLAFSLLWTLGVSAGRWLIGAAFLLAARDRARGTGPGPA